MKKGSGHAHIAFSHSLEPLTIAQFEEDSDPLEPIGPAIFNDNDAPKIYKNSTMVGFTKFVQVGGRVDMSLSELTTNVSLTKN